MGWRGCGRDLPKNQKKQYPHPAAHLPSNDDRLGMGYGCGGGAMVGGRPAGPGRSGGGVGSLTQGLGGGPNSEI
jgi:hypothetical protein